MNRNLKLGIFGFGVVGQGLYHVLEETKGIKAEILKICVKNPNKTRPLPMKYFTYEKEDILDNPEVDVVLELIDDPIAAYEIVTAALKKGKAVVTANKKMVADHMTELYELQKKYNAPFPLTPLHCQPFRQSSDTALSKMYQHTSEQNPLCHHSNHDCGQ